MSRIFGGSRAAACSLTVRRISLAIVALAAHAGPSAAQAPMVELTQIGSPIWRPVDFELFSAPMESDAEWEETFDAIVGDTYTDHAPPYDDELSANVAAAGFVSRSVFPREALDNNPNGIVFPILVLPDPGIIGESRDFASGPIIPNSLFPFSGPAEVWKNGTFLFSLDPGLMEVRPEDAPFEGTSHRIRVGGMWSTGPNPFGSFEVRWSLIDTAGNGWDMVFPFKVVRAGDFDEDGDVDAADLPQWTGGFGQSSAALHADGDADFDGDVDGTDFLVWQRQLGQSSPAAAPSAVPEPSTLAALSIGALAIASAARSRQRFGGVTALQRISRAAASSSNFCRLAWAIAPLVAATAERAGAQAPMVELTQVGSPIWRPVDPQLFTAPQSTDEEWVATANAVLPLDPQGVTTYATPHGPPYDAELSTNLVAAGFVSQSVFPREAIMNNPNGVFFAITLAPDPGVIGSSRDFASGPVIPNSLFPLSGHIEVWLEGALAIDLGAAQPGLRPTDEPFEGTSHRTLFTTFWNRGANNLGNYEIRAQLVDTQGNGWSMMAPLKVVHAGDFEGDGDVDPADLPLWTGGFGQTSGALHAEGDADFDGDVDGTDFLAWQRQLGQASALPAASTVPEPSAGASGYIAACGLAAAARRRTRKGGLPCAAQDRRHSCLA